MCGIIAVVQRPARRTPPSADQLVALADDAMAALRETRIDDVAADLELLDGLLRGASGTLAILTGGTLSGVLQERLRRVDDEAATLEVRADDGALSLEGDELEAFNAALVRVKDASWSIRRDR